MRVVIDTNVWISGLLWKGAPWKILRLVDALQIKTWATASMLKELENTLAYPRLQPRLLELKLEIADLLAYVVDSIILIELDRVEAIVKADPDDDVFVNCADAVSAQYLISGNKHLLNLKQWRSVLMVSPQDFLAREFPEFD
jgi:uncharacterized protein